MRIYPASKSKQNPPLVEGRQLKMILRSIRLALRNLCGRRSQKQRTVDCLLQTERSVDVTPQIGDNHLLVHDTVCSGESAVSRERDIHHPICKSESWRKLIENERSMRNVVNPGLYVLARGARGDRLP